MEFIVFIAVLVGLWVGGGRLYRRWYWWDRKRRIQMQIRYGMKDGTITRQAIDEMRERGDI